MKGDRVMPIGFWAISRRDIEQYLAYKRKEIHKPAPTVEDINRAIRVLQDNLDNTFEQTLIDFIIK